MCVVLDVAHVSSAHSPLATVVGVTESVPLGKPVASSTTRERSKATTMTPTATNSHHVDRRSRRPAKVAGSSNGDVDRTVTICQKLR